MMTLSMKFVAALDNLIKQGFIADFNDLKGGKAIDALPGRRAWMITREIIRVIREVDDEVFEKAGVNPKHHRENFTKVIDAIMREL